MEISKKTVPMPPVPKRDLFVSIDFWLEVIQYLDHKLQTVSQASGHGEVELSIKVYKGKIFEVNFLEKNRLREIISKAAQRGTPNPLQTPLDSTGMEKEDPALFAK